MGLVLTLSMSVNCMVHENFLMRAAQLKIDALHNFNICMACERVMT